MLRIRMSAQAQREYESWLLEGNLKIADKIDALLASASETPFSGIGKPEPLRGNLSGLWSRRITHRDRLVYRANRDTLDILQCRGHYDDK